ncbi:putative bifunctional diguanylate cyclase/phosphodiesterase [Aliidiomarina indica]|uniref:putative bifunctional diguanylate cyclase/phosphodiesterase n=1 Tax=Aliidiomarina indica TaxID=2749147 RepID=UPI00188EAEFD|nr:EAL domain-containing protein [Aliidiomarina indica]
MRKLRKHREAIIAGLTGVVLTLLLTFSLRYADNVNIRDQLDAELYSLQLEVRRELQSHMFGFTWISRQGLNGPAWVSEGETITSYYRHFRTLYWITPTGDISARYPAVQTPSQVPQDIQLWLPKFNHGVRYLISADGMGEHPADLLLIVPQLETEPNGYYAGLLDTNRLLHLIVGRHIVEGSQFRVMRQSDGGILFNYANDDSLRVQWGSDRVFQLFGESWHMELWPSPARLQSMRSKLPLLVLISGALVTTLMTFVLYLLGVSRVRERMLKEANRELYDEIEEREKIEKRVAYLAEHDSLTGLANRNAVIAHLKSEIMRLREQKELIGVLLIDLDHFKEVNDTLGHNIGDALLKQVAARLSELHVGRSLLARLGGDEFAILVSDLQEQKDLEDFADEVIAALDTAFHVEGYEIFVTGSIGISLTQTGEEDAEELMRHADTALYRAKDKGRNIWHVYSQELHDELSERLDLSKKLRYAIEQNKLVVYYQPQVDMTTRKVIGVEALVRWIEDDGSMIGPDRFIPIAEDSGLIVPISEFVLQTACRQLARWRDLGFNDLRVSVNISGRLFQLPDLTEQILFAVKSAGIPTAFLELELTEQVLIENSSAHTQFMHDMRDNGITLAIDDFGVGYSSLSYLKHFPINALKIDRSFVKDLPDDKDDATITQTIVSLARNLDIGIVAEGVETQEQADFLIARGCTIGQGFYYSRPLPADELTQLLTQPDGVIPVKIS